MRRADLLERKLGDLDAAADAWLAAVRIDPTERHALARWAALCAQLQRYSDRATALQGWADAASDPAEASAVLLHLADMQQHDLEDEEGARQSYQRLLEVAPDHAVARAALERLA
jgi:tetratricopeptide (TPR) repeat protein